VAQVVVLDLGHGPPARDQPPGDGRQLGVGAVVESLAPVPAGHDHADGPAPPLAPAHVLVEPVDEVVEDLRHDVGRELRHLGLGQRPVGHAAQALANVLVGERLELSGGLAHGVAPAVGLARERRRLGLDLVRARRARVRERGHSLPRAQHREPVLPDVDVAGAVARAHDPPTTLVPARRPRASVPSVSTEIGERMSRSVFIQSSHDQASVAV
jgi:hypothetical protein